MNVTYDHHADAAYIRLAPRGGPAEVKRTYHCDPKAVNGIINLDFDADGRLLGIEVLGASRRLPAPVLQAARQLGPPVPADEPDERRTNPEVVALP